MANATSPPKKVLGRCGILHAVFAHSMDIGSTMVTYMMWVHSQKQQSKNVHSLQVLLCRPSPKPCLV